MRKGDVRKDGQYPYIKVFPDEYMGGSLHYGCSLTERGFFMDILCLAAKNRKERGTLSLEVGKPMSNSMIANALFIDDDTCQNLTNRMIEQERLTRREDGVLVVENFDFYQKKYRRSKMTKEIQQAHAIKANVETRTRKYTRHNPDIAQDELDKIDSEKQLVKDTNDAIDDLENRHGSNEVKDNDNGN